MKLVKGYDWEGVPEDSGFDKPLLHSLRGRKGGREARMSEVSQRAEIERLTSAIEKGDGGSKLAASLIELCRAL